MPRKAKTVARGYDAKHKALRRKWERVVKLGNAFCVRCGRPIAPGSEWDLGHDDFDRTIHTGPEHRSCNRATASRRKGVARMPSSTRGLPDGAARVVLPRRHGALLAAVDYGLLLARPGRPEAGNRTGRPLTEGRPIRMTLPFSDQQSFPLLARAVDLPPLIS